MLTNPVNIAVFAVFRSLFGILSTQMPNSSRFVPCGNLTFGVMGGKNGKMWQDPARWAAKTG